MEKIPNELTEEQKLQTSPEITNETPVEGEEVQTPVEETPQTDTGEVDNAVEETIPTPPHQPEEDSEEEPEVLTAEVEEEKEYVIPDTNEGIISRLNTLADNAEQSEKAELDLLKQVFYKRIKEEKAKKYAEFINGGGKEEEFQLQPNPLEDEFKKIMTIIKDQRNKMMMAIEKVLLAEKARETYEVKKGGFTKAIKMKSASPSNPCAILRVTGRPIELKQFKVSPASYKPEKRPVTTKARVVKVNSMKPLEKNGIKAFIVKYKNGHVSVATRDSSSRYPIRSLYSASIPSMIGSRRYVYGILEPKLQDILRQQVDRQINRVLAGR